MRPMSQCHTDSVKRITRIFREATMQQETVDKIKDITAKLAETIDIFKPQNPNEWEAKEALTAAHKQLRKIDVDSLADRERRASITR